MAITFVGFFRPTDTNFFNAAFRETGGFPAEMQEKVRGFPSSLPETCKLIGSWPTGPETPGVTVVEVESFADLQAIDQHYQGWVQFDWHPSPSGGVARD